MFAAVEINTQIRPVDLVDEFEQNWGAFLSCFEREFLTFTCCVVANAHDHFANGYMIGILRIFRDAADMSGR